MGPVLLATVAGVLTGTVIASVYLAMDRVCVDFFCVVSDTVLMYLFVSKQEKWREENPGQKMPIRRPPFYVGPWKQPEYTDYEKNE
jgi:hypothetical protein